MQVSKHWSVTIDINERPADRATTAQARLSCDDGHSFAGEGAAQRFPRDPELPDVGDDLAAARALEDLSRQLTMTAYERIGAGSDRLWEEA